MNGVPFVSWARRIGASRGATSFVCADGSTIALDQVADASENCPDGSDEWLP